MSRYRHTGKYDFAPDRGSPNGNQQSFTRTFTATCDVTAKANVTDWKKGRVDIVDEKLVRIDVAEQTSVVALD